MNKVMIVEDDAGIRKLFARILSENGFEIIECSSGNEAIIKYDAMDEKPSVILVDNKMPNGTGIDFSKKILDRDPNSKILMISGDPDINFQFLHKYGIRFKPKPITKTELISEVDLLKDMNLSEDDSSVNYFIFGDEKEHEANRSLFKRKDLQFIRLSD